jgi:hypothetical protein
MQYQGLQELFTDHKVWFASPASFNDPFDCKVRSMLIEGGQEAFLDRHVQSSEPTLTLMHRSIRVRELLESGVLEDPKYRAQVLSFVQKCVDKSGVYSLSTSLDHPLLWSHYADGHRGLCLEFQHMIDLFPEIQLQNAFPVSYATTFPKLSESGTRGEHVQATLLTKAVYWEYEQEWRFIDPTGGPGLRRFCPRFLSSVIFGCLMKEEDKARVRGWIAESRATPKLFQAERKARDYALQIVPV